MRPRASLSGLLVVGLAAAGGILGIVRGMTSGAPVAVVETRPAPAPLLKPAEPAALPAGAEKVRVARVVDGDTVQLADGRKVRYLGIDTPEHDQNFFAEARDFNARWVLDRDAYLEFDVERTDKYGRLLAFVWVLGDSGPVNVNLEIVRNGLAYVYTPGPCAKHKEEMLAGQRAARERQLGFWKNYVLGASDRFVTTRNGHAFHRPGCEAIKAAGDLKEWTSRDEVLDAGFSPCRTCKP